MTRFVLSPFASEDLDGLIAYLEALPKRPALRIGKAIRRMLEQIGESPLLGTTQSELTRMMGFEVRSRLVESYRILYRTGGTVPEIIGVLHSARDVRKAMAKRVQ